MENSEFLEKINEIERDAKRFEVSLRVGFIKDSQNNHIAIQRVNTECEMLKQKIRAVLNIKTTNTRDIFKRDSVVTSAMSHIGKFEHVKEAGIPLTGDVYILYANAHTLRNPKNDKK